MLDYLKRNGQFALMIIIWVVAGMVLRELATALVALSVILLKRRNMYSEMVSGFILVLVFSDSHLECLQFARDAKLIYLVLMSLFYFFNRNEFKYRSGVFMPYLPFFIWAIFLVVRNPTVAVSVQKTVSYFLLFLVGPAYVVKILQEKGTSFIRDHVLLMSFMLIAGLIMFVVANDKVLVAERFTGILGNPNGIGLFCTVFFLLFQCAIIKFPNLFSKNDKIIVYILIGLSVVLSGSRNTMISIILFLFFSRFYRISPILGAGIVLITAVVYQVIISNLPEILQALGLAKALRADTLESGSGRLIAWTFGWKLINSDLWQFFVGRGFGFDEWFFIQNAFTLNKLGHIGGIHNSYLALWINTGIIGLILWLTGFFRIIAKSVKKTYATLPLMYAVMFSATFEAWLMASLNPYTITLLVTLTFLGFEEVKNKTKSEPELPDPGASADTEAALQPQA